MLNESRVLTTSTHTHTEDQQVSTSTLQHLAWKKKKICNVLVMGKFQLYHIVALILKKDSTSTPIKQFTKAVCRFEMIKQYIVQKDIVSVCLFVVSGHFYSLSPFTPITMTTKL